MKKLLFLIILIAVCSSLHSQEYPFKIYTSPLLAADFFSRPMISLGGEYVIADKWGIAAEYGLKYRNNYERDTTWIKSKGYTYRLELKYYDIHKFKKSHLRNYISLEYRYIKDNHTERFDYDVDSLSVDHSIDCFGVMENIYIGNIKYGIIIRIGKRFYTDVYCGLGLRYRDIKNTHREYNTDLGHEPAHVDSLFDGYGLDDAAGFKPNFSLGFKFGIRF
jgi:hypothetical protein